MQTSETTYKKELSDPAVYPDDAVLKGVLGRSFQAYCALLELFDLNHLLCEWRYYMDGKAWLLKVQKKKRTIIWMSAWSGFMKATIYIPEKLSDALFDLPIREETRDRIRTTEHVGRSIPCIFEIRNQKILRDLDRVMQFKIQTR